MVWNHTVTEVESGCRMEPVCPVMLVSVQAMEAAWECQQVVQETD